MKLDGYVTNSLQQKEVMMNDEETEVILIYGRSSNAKTSTGLILDI